MRRRRSAKPPAELLEQITAAAAAGDDALVDRLSAQAVRDQHDTRRRATPLPIGDADQ